MCMDIHSVRDIDPLLESARNQVRAFHHRQRHSSSDQVSSGFQHMTKKLANNAKLHNRL